MSQKDDLTGNAVGVEQETIVREVTCKTILNRCPIGDYSLNCYTGCTHPAPTATPGSCSDFTRTPSRGVRFVDVKINAVETLKRQLRRAEPGEVFLSSACDGWQPIEAQLRADSPLLRTVARTGVSAQRADQERFGACAISTSSATVPCESESRSRRSTNDCGNSGNRGRSVFADGSR